MRYLIDTNICIYIMNQRDQSLIQRFKKIPIGEICISSITLSELSYGVYKSSSLIKNKQRLQEFILPFHILFFNKKSAEIYGQIRSQPEKKGQTIGSFDMLIASHAMSEDLVLVTNNDKEFKRIKNLKIENWLK